MWARRGAQFVPIEIPTICWKTFPAETTKMFSTRNSSILMMTKRRRSDPVQWQKPLHQQKCQKGKVPTQTTPQKSSIKQRLRTELGRSVGVTTATQLLWSCHHGVMMSSSEYLFLESSVPLKSMLRRDPKLDICICDYRFWKWRSSKWC